MDALDGASVESSSMGLPQVGGGWLRSVSGDRVDNPADLLGGVGGGQRTPSNAFEASRGRDGPSECDTETGLDSEDRRRVCRPGKETKVSVWNGCEL